jgi:tetratricopeptide (TPR) repeat protein
MRRSSALRRTVPLILAIVALPSRPAGASANEAIEARVRAAYPQVLAVWASGDEVQAVRQLADLETSVVSEQRGPRDVETLWRAKLGVVRETISRSSVEILVPVMLLHQNAYRYYVDRRMGLLAHHSQTMASELAEFYAENSSSPTAHRVAADLLVSLGGYMQSGLMMRRSAELFNRALAVDSTHHVAHLGLGSLYERRGELADAERHYAAATRLAPDDAEAFLRHGVCAARLGDTALALKQLDRALALDGPEWVRRVAFQEKARAQATPSDGASVAEQGRELFPASSRQAIQLAFLLDQERRPREALEVLSHLSQDPEPESERYQYARWPEGGLAAVRERLEVAARSGRSTLALATRAYSNPVPSP